MAYKDKEKGGWIAQWYEVDATGKKKHHKKRGFKTLRDAKKFESEKLLKDSGSMDMCLGDFVEVYFEDRSNSLKDRTMVQKKTLMEKFIVPYFGDNKMSEITPLQITKWQTEMYAKNYSESYLRQIQNQLTSLFTHANKIYDLNSNPCKKVERMGKDEASKFDFWTLDEYEEFIETINPNDKYHLLFEILFWTGMREGECLALTKSDIDFAMDRIDISKTVYRKNGKDIITTPKTDNSVRVIDIPLFLAEELKDWCDKHYGMPDDARFFEICARSVQKKFDSSIKRAGLKKIRVHDLRHSHVAHLINQNVEPLVIKERLGHKDIRITLNTYGHLYPNKQKKVAALLDGNRTNKKES